MLALLQFFTYIFGAYSLSALVLVPVAMALHLRVPVDRVIQRGGMIVAILGLWPFLRWLGLANLEALGYRVSRAELLRAVFLGLLLGIWILICLVAALLWLGVRVPTVGVSLYRLPGVMAEGLMAGLLVAMLEETFFRGALFAAIRRDGTNAVLAIVGSSLLYAILHFLRPQPLPPGVPVTVSTVLDSLMGTFTNLWQLQNLDAGVSLLLVGVFLALARERSCQQGWNLGLHAGWVMVIKVTHTYTDVAYSSPWVSLVGSYDGITGWLAAAG